MSYEQGLKEAKKRFDIFNEVWVRDSRNDRVVLFSKRQLKRCGALQIRFLYRRKLMSTLYWLFSNRTWCTPLYPPPPFKCCLTYFFSNALGKIPRSIWKQYFRQCVMRDSEIENSNEILHPRFKWLSGNSNGKKGENVYSCFIPVSVINRRQINHNHR